MACEIIINLQRRLTLAEDAVAGLERGLELLRSNNE